MPRNSSFPVSSTADRCRFLLHVLPDGLMRIRHFGFLANRSKKQNLSRCRELLGLNPALPEIPKKSPQQLMLELTGIDISRCKKETLRIVADLQRSLRWTPHDKRTD